MASILKDPLTIQEYNCLSSYDEFVNWHFKYVKILTLEQWRVGLPDAYKDYLKQRKLKEDAEKEFYNQFIKSGIAKQSQDGPSPNWEGTDTFDERKVFSPNRSERSTSCQICPEHTRGNDNDSSTTEESKALS